MGFGNLELRWKFASIATEKSTFDFQIVPFVDFGRVWDGAERMNLKDYKYSYGLGFRIPWNQSTIIYFDYAISREDRQLFVNFQHIF
jgi:hemolysin activation/secretion protein